MSQELKRIKKLYGESMARFCRDNFSTILEEEGRLLEILTNKFDASHCLFKDISFYCLEEGFKNFIYNLYKISDTEEPEVEKTPQELLSGAGYDLYECKTEKDIQRFKKYYAPGEELCTFRGGRLNICRVFFAVKKNVEEIKRKNFTKPERQDEYGTSVISIQFSTNGVNTLSIKNRYNHTVKNPDATYSNNLDNIVVGLTKSFEKYYGIVQRHISGNFEIPYYIIGNDGKYYKYNDEIGNVYYCTDNVIIDNFEVKKYEKEKYIVLDYFILDLVKKEIKVYDKRNYDSFCDSLNNIKNIEVKKKENGKSILLTLEEDNVAVIDIDSNNQIIGYKNNLITEIGDAFLCNAMELKELELLNLTKIGDDFLKCNDREICLSIPNVEEVGRNFLEHNEQIPNIEFLKLKKIGDWFFYCNKYQKTVNLPLLEEVGHGFLHGDEYLTTLTLPNLRKCENDFLYHNKCLSQVNLPNLRNVGSSFLRNNMGLVEMSLPSLKKAKDYFLFCNIRLTKIELPELLEVGNYFCGSNISIKSLSLPNIEKIGYKFLYDNTALLKLYLPMVQQIGDDFLARNEQLKELKLTNLKYLKSFFLRNNQGLKELYLPNIKEIEDCFMKVNKSLTKIDAPMLEIVGDYFLSINEQLEDVNLPNLKTTGIHFLEKLYENKQQVKKL